MPELKELTLYVLRHGECEHTRLGVVAGQNDSPMTPLGRLQAAANGKLLMEMADAPDRLDYYSSPLHRAAETMEILRESAGLPRAGYFADRRLMEIDCGRNTWRKWSDIETDLARDPLWKNDRWNIVHPGGESLSMLHERVGSFLRELQQDAVLVAHAGTMRMIRAHVLGLSKAETMEYHPPNAGILRLSAGTEAYFGE